MESGLTQLLSTTRGIHPFVLRHRATVPSIRTLEWFLVACILLSRHSFSTSQPKKRLATIHVLKQRRLCCQSLHLASGQTPWNDKLGDNKGTHGEERQAWRWIAGTRSRRKAMVLKHEPHHQRRRQRCGRHHPYHDYRYLYRERLERRTTDRVEDVMTSGAVAVKCSEMSQQW